MTGVAAALTLLLGVQQAASAPADPNAPLRESFARFDADRDDAMTFAEYVRWEWHGSYARGDANADGQLSWQEFLDKDCGRLRSEGIPRKYYEWCSASANRNFRREARRGVIGFAEFARKCRRYFRINDRNGDGLVTIDEVLSTPYSPRK
jgi:hypothetical protein